MPDPGLAPRGLRVAVILTGLGLLFWLPFEDQNERPALFFALLLCALAGAFLLHRLGSLGVVPLWAYPLLGMLCGLALSPLAVLLLALKSGLHSHAAPDYTIVDLVSVLEKTPVWAGVGLLFGLSVGLWGLYRHGKLAGL